MNVILEGVTDLPTRRHPYEGAKYDSRVRHYDFVKEPELIRQVLEDFKPWEQYKAIEYFYRVLDWVNGDNGIFETSDCRLERPKKNPHQNIPYGQALFGRVMVLFRNWNLNYADILPNQQYFVSEPLQQLSRGATEYIRGVHPEARVTIQIFLAPAKFCPENKTETFGHQVMFQFNCFGDSETELFEGFALGVDAVGGCLKQAVIEWKK